MLVHTGLCWYVGLCLFATAAYANNDAVVLQSYGRIPMLFEENAGQASAGTKFVARGPGYTTLLRWNGPELHLNNGQTDLRFRWIGGSTHPNVSARDQAVTRSNYFLGNDPALWKTNIKNYQSVEYSNVYPGIDLVFHGNQSQLEYDWRVAPAVDPAVIRLRFE